MSNLFDDFDFDDDEPAPTPDWLREVDDKGNASPEGTAAAPTPAPAAAPGIDVDRLREKSARAGAMDDAITSDAAVARSTTNGEGGFFARMSPAQRLIIALFFLADLCLMGTAVLLLLKVI